MDDTPSLVSTHVVVMVCIALLGAACPSLAGVTGPRLA